MGRRKLDEAPSVGNKKNLMKSFNKKKSYIDKKASELSTLCDVPVCVIIYGPNGDEPPCIWPNEPQRFNNILTRYMNTSSEDRNKRALNLTSMPKNQVLDAGNGKQIEKLPNTGFRTLDDGINSLSSEQLTGLVDHLNSKLDIVNSRIDVMKQAIQNSAKLENQQLYHAAQEQKMMGCDMQTMQNLQYQYQYQYPNHDYLRYLEEQRRKTEMPETMNQGGFYNINNNNNNNNVNVGDYSGFMRGNMANGLPMYDPRPLAWFGPQAQLQAQPHQSYNL